MNNLNDKIAIVQLYIKTRKDVDVDIRLDNPLDIPKLLIAYDVAVQWFKDNNVKISML